MSSRRPGYREYVEDAEHMRVYSDYQRRYAETLRESDRVLVDLVREHARPGASLLDMGCSTGNLLGHLKRLTPELELHGADVVASVIEDCRADPALAGIEFHTLDMLDLDLDRRFDIVTANAALMFFTPEEFARALAQLGTIVAPGGHLIAFDYVHPFDQQIALVETSSAFPEGLKLFFRGEGVVDEALAAGGFEAGSYRAFEIPIDLPRPDDRSAIKTWTRRTDDGVGLSFRGTLFQPWCHFVARKAG
jgi:SAM-dependent methyltransferase